jgi:hypothetical protein
MSSCVDVPSAIAWAAVGLQKTVPVFCINLFLVLPYENVLSLGIRTRSGLLRYSYGRKPPLVECAPPQLANPASGRN